MRGSVCLVALLSMPATAQSPALRVGLSCEGAIPEFLVVDATGPATLVIRMSELYAACIADMPESKRWRAAS